MVAIYKTLAYLNAHLPAWTAVSLLFLCVGQLSVTCSSYFVLLLMYFNFIPDLSFRLGTFEVSLGTTDERVLDPGVPRRPHFRSSSSPETGV